MCGIVGYVGPRDGSEIVMQGLRQLEYRGYDSAGLAVLDESGLVKVRREEGKLDNLMKLLSGDPMGLDGAHSAVLELYPGVRDHVLAVEVRPRYESFERTQ